MSIEHNQMRKFNMCGIVGVAGFIGEKEKKAFSMMLQLDVLRGKDSTGIIGVSNTGQVMTAKEAWLPQDFLSCRAAKDIMNKNLRALVGHNRHATVGAVNKAGAHPFEFENIVGVHNGTTSKYMFEDHANYDVDSEALYHHANKKGIGDAWKNLTGAASLVFFDKKESKLGFLRNNQRPMEIAFSPDGRTMFFASEPWMIVVATERAGLKVGEIKSTKTDNLYVFDPMANPFNMAEFKNKEIPAYVAPTRKLSSNVTPIRGSGLNNTAIVVSDIKLGEKVKFEFVKVHTNYNSSYAEIQTTSTVGIIPGRIYLHCATEEQVDNFLKSTNEFIGEVSSITPTGHYKGFSIRLSSVKELVPEEKTDDLDIEDAILFDGGASFTKEEFEKGVGIDPCCAWCGNPVDFDSLDFKGIGKNHGKQQVVCDDCLKAYGDDIEGYVDIQDVFDIALSI